MRVDSTKPRGQQESTSGTHNISAWHHKAQTGKLSNGALYDLPQVAAQQADLVVLEIPDSHWLLYTNTKHCFFFFFSSHFNTITPLCTDAESCQCSCSISTYELCRWHSHSYLFSKCHGYSLPRTVAQLLNLCHNEVVNTTIKPHEYSHQNNSTKVPRDQEAN